MSGLNKAISKQGGLTALANSLGLTKATVFNWKLRGNVPAEYCPTIERLTGVRCEDLNDKVDWTYLRQSVCAPNTHDRRTEDKEATA